MEDKGSWAASPFSPLPQYIRCRIVLVWMERSSPLYGPLSTNILREICEFFARIQFLSVWAKKELIVFNPVSRESRSISFRQLQISWEYQYRGECTFIEDSNLFLCGGKVRDLHSNSAFCTRSTYLIYDEQRNTLRSMHKGRYQHGLFYHEESRSVFAFGGCQDSDDKTKSCEQYEIFTNSWQSLPDMNDAKINISICGYQRTLFVLDGYLFNIESFSIESRQFTRVPIQLEDSCEENVIAMWKGKLVILSQTRVRMFDANTYAAMEDVTIERGYFGSHSVVVNDEIFSLFDIAWIVFNLETKNFYIYLHDDQNRK